MNSKAKDCGSRKLLRSWAKNSATPRRTFIVWHSRKKRSVLDLVLFQFAIQGGPVHSESFRGFGFVAAYGFHDSHNIFPFQVPERIGSCKGVGERQHVVVTSDQRRR